MTRLSFVAVALMGAAGSIVAACSTTQVNTALSTPAGALFCAIQTNGGGAMIVSVIDAEASAAAPAASPVAVIATGLAKADVDSLCATAAKNAGGTAGIAVSPPAATIVVPQVAVTVTAAATK